MSLDENGVRGHLAIEKARVWDLKTTGQVSTSGRTQAGISCLCFHPTDPTLCVVTVQGTTSVLSFYNVYSGGKMSTVPLQSVVAAAEFTKDGDQIVVIFRDWIVMMLRPGSPVWSRHEIPFKKDTKPAEHLLLALTPTVLPVIFFASVGQQKVNVVFTSAPASKGSLLSSQKTSFATKITTTAIIAIASCPQDPDQLIAMFTDGIVQAFTLEQTTLRKLFIIAENGHLRQGQLCQLEVVSHPFLPTSSLIMVAAERDLVIYASNERGHAAEVGAISLKGMKRIMGIGIHKEARVFLVFGEMNKGNHTCLGARFSGNQSGHITPLNNKEPFPSGMSLVPVSVSFSSSATDVMVPNHSISGVVDVADRGNGSWMELWDAVPAWAQSVSVLCAAHSKIRSVKMHAANGVIAAQSAAGTTGSGPHVLLWSIRDASHPVGGSTTALVIPQHTALSFWDGQSTNQEYKLEFPHHCYYAAMNRLSSYAFRSKEVNDVFFFQPPSGRHGVAVSESMTFSKHQRAWLAFFRSFSKDDSNGIDEWTYTLLREDDVGASPPWHRPGISGVFIGPLDEHFCILDLDLYTVHVFPTKTASSRDRALLSLSLPSPGLMMPALFQGPPITQIPKPPPPPEFTESGQLTEPIQEEEGKEVKLGYGVIIWVNKFREIAMGTMISETGSRRRYESEAPEFIQGGTFNELSEGEIIIQVAWQILSETENAHEAPNSYTAAVLTNQRLMLFLANGYPVLSFPPQNSPGLYSPPTSCLWVGPALLYVTRSGEVNQLLWDGSTVMICGAPSATGSAILVAALADRILFLCRETASQSWQVATRHAIIGYVLLMGWASLACSGLMPPTWVHAHVRNRMKMVLQHFDVSTVSAPVARALVLSDFADVARAIANRWPNEAQRIQVACSVAAKKWEEAAEGLMKEYKASVYHPHSIPKGSAMWVRFYSVAVGAVRHGASEIGARLFAAASEWECALVFLSLSSSVSKMHEIVQSAGQSLEPSEITKLTALVDQLRARALSNAGALPSSTEEAAFDDPSFWSFAAPGHLPPMYCIQGDSPNGMIKDGDLGRIDPLETTDIKGYVSGESKAVTTRSTFLRRSFTHSTASGRSFLPVSGKDSPSPIPEGATAEDGFDFFAVQSSSARNDRPQRGFDDLASFGQELSSDEDDDTGASDRGSGFGKKFRIQIKKKEESHGATSSEALREAAKNLKLGGYSFSPSLGPGGFAAAMKGGSNIDRTESMSSSSSHSHLDSKINMGTFPETSVDPFASRSAVPPIPPPSTTTPVMFETDFFGLSTSTMGNQPAEQFQTGVKEMEGGNWQAAIDVLSRLNVLSYPKAKQYLAAVLLLNERATATGSDAARLDRHAAALELEDKHRKQMTLQAIQENMSIGNYGYAKERLRWLMESSKDKVAPQVIANLKKQYEECEAAGSTDEEISLFENLDAVAKAVEGATNVENLKVLINGFSY